VNFKMPTPMQLRFRRNKSYWKSVVFGVFLTIFWLPEVIFHTCAQGVALIVMGLWDIVCSMFGELCSFFILLGAGVAGNVDLDPHEERPEDGIGEDGDDEG
jgi:hypothetical protein